MVGGGLVVRAIDGRVNIIGGGDTSVAAGGGVVEVGDRVAAGEGIVEVGGGDAAEE